MLYALLNISDVSKSRPEASCYYFEKIWHLLIRNQKIRCQDLRHKYHVLPVQGYYVRGGSI